MDIGEIIKIHYPEERPIAVPAWPKRERGIPAPDWPKPKREEVEKEEEVEVGAK